MPAGSRLVTALNYALKPKAAILQVCKAFERNINAALPHCLHGTAEQSGTVSGNNAADPQNRRFSAVYPLIKQRDVQAEKL